jgi:coproporphyrinogen III oxidase-like Fe-S oxidoreductase
MTRLRTSEGLNIDECLAQFGRTPADVDAATYHRYLQEGVLAQENGCVRVAEKAWLMGDRIASDFFWV